MDSELPAAVLEARALYERQQRWFGGRPVEPEASIAAVLHAFESEGARWTLVGADRVDRGERLEF